MMKTGKTLQELASELTRQNEAKADYIAPPRQIEAVAELDKGERVTRLDLAGHDSFGINNHAHGQLATYTDIPKRYYDRLTTDAPELWAANVNRWLGTMEDKQRRMVRTMDGDVRALLSDRYRTLENFDLATAVLPVLTALGGDKPLQVVSCDVTQTKMYIKAVDPNREEAIDAAFAEQNLVRGRGHGIIDVVSPSIVIQNSEVGSGTLAIMTSIYVKACTNLCVWEGGEMKKYHLGKRAELSDEVYAMLTDETRATTDKAIWLQAKDVTKAAFDDVRFNGRVQKLKETTQNEITGKATEVVEKVSRHLGINQTEQESVLEHLIRGGDFTQYGLHNAVTRTAQDVESYDRASELEKLGGRVIELPKNDWERLAA